MTEQEALQLVSDHSGKSFDEMLAIAKAQGHDETAVKLRFQSLWQKGYTSGVFQFGYPVTLYPEGLDKLIEYQQADEHRKQATNQYAQEEKERKSQHKLAILSLLVTAIFGILTLVVDLLGIIPPGFFESLGNRVNDWVKQLVQQWSRILVTFHQHLPLP